VAGRRTLGVEEELFLVDPETLDLAPGVERILGPPGLKTELFSCFVELNTGICASPDEALAELTALRRVVRAAAERDGLAVAAAAAHPFAVSGEQEIVQEPRYLALLAERPAAKRQIVCGLHVHVGCESLAESIERLEAILPWLPAVLALSANSPWVDGRADGTVSGRAARLLELPRAGAPPLLAGDGWERALAASGGDYTMNWWDVRPHPRLGTLEVRVPDQPTSVRRTAALTALVEALVEAAPRREPLDRDAYAEARADAAAGGRAATGDLLALVEPAARALGTWELVETLREPPEAHRQLEVGRRDGLVAAVADIVARTD
jgi:glutamate---cysteine ligase / carboxylate-amine ligase